MEEISKKRFDGREQRIRNRGQERKSQNLKVDDGEMEKGGKRSNNISRLDLRLDN